MMRTGAIVVAAATMLTLSGCSKKEAPPTINESMTGVMEPTAQTIWDTVSRAYNDLGDGLEPSKLTDDDWTKLADASQKLKDRATIFANATHVVVATSNEPILGSHAAGIKGNVGPAWDALNAQQVQARIDAQPALFAEKARTLAESADAIHRAAATRDTALLYKVSSDLDEVCDGCHEPFWGTDEPPPFPQH